MYTFKHEKIFRNVKNIEKQTYTVGEYILTIS